MPEIVVAMTAKIDFVKMTNPFGSSEKKTKKQQLTMPPDDELKAMFSRAARSKK